MNTYTAAQSCTNCNGPVEKDPKHGEWACADCGTIISDGEIDRSPEWRAFDARERDEKSRVGRPTTVMMHDKGLSTQISWKDQDGYGQQLSSRKRKQMQRLRTWNERCRTRNGQERTLRQALGEINRMASALGLPQSARETAGVIYRRALNEGLLHGRSIEGVATGAVYAAARQESIPRTLTEMGTVARVEQRCFARDYRMLAGELGLAIEPPDPTDYLPRFASELDLPPHIQRQAYDILISVIGTPYMSGKNPVGLAASALYASAHLADEQLTQHAVSDVSDIARMTIRTHYRELIEQYREKSVDAEVCVDG